MGVEGGYQSCNEWRASHQAWAIVLGIGIGFTIFLGIGFSQYIYNQFCINPNTIQYYTILQKNWSEESEIYERKTEGDEMEEEKHS